MIRRKKRKTHSEIEDEKHDLTPSRAVSRGLPGWFDLDPDELV
jgi:hypothetical protein